MRLPPLEATTTAEATPPVSLANGAIQKAFAKYDRDGTGKIEAKELRGCLRSLGVLVDEAEGDEIIARYDADANNVLTIDEFEVMLRELEALRAKYTTQEKKARQSSAASMPAPDGKSPRAEGVSPAPGALPTPGASWNKEFDAAEQASEPVVRKEAYPVGAEAMDGGKEGGDSTPTLDC